MSARANIGDVSDEPEPGKWITVRPDDPRIENGSRVRLGGVEGRASRFATRLACHVGGRSVAAWVVRNTSGPDVELWVPAEVTLPLPTEPGPFWGRVERDGDAYVGWVLWVVDHDGAPYWTTHRVGGFSCHYREHVTVLPLPDDRREALR